MQEIHREDSDLGFDSDPYDTNPVNRLYRTLCIESLLIMSS